MFDPVQTPPEPHYPPKLNTKFEFQNSIFKIQFSKFKFSKFNFSKKFKNQFLKIQIFIIQIFKMLTKFKF